MVGAYRHGTACAGIIAAAKNNVCGVGIAYGAKVANLRLLTVNDTITSQSDEVEALNHRSDDISIYSSSYGPPDDGMSIDGPSYVTSKALLNGVNNGRRFKGEGKGKGSIYVVAAGNGLEAGDECNFDGYTNR